MEFRLPALGEGIDSATVVGILVKPGDALTPGQNVISIETDKASMEVPIEEAGSVASLAVKAGDKIPVGGLILTLTTAPVQATPTPAAKPATPAPAPTAAPAPASAPTKSEFTLPALGEGIDSATVVGVLVKAGDKVTVGQNVIAVETDKASMEVPIEVAGVIDAIHVKQGDKIPVGAKILSITSDAVVRAAPAAVPATSSNGTPPKAAPVATQPTAIQPRAVETNGVKTIVAAGPATRRLARELGTSLAQIPGSARGGRVTLEDVKGFVRNRMEQLKTGPVGKVTGSVVDVFTHPPLPDFGKYGAIEKKPLSNIRKKIAENLTIAVRMMPTVTQNDLADITDLEGGRKRIADAVPKGSPKVTWTVLAVKAVVAALKEFPNFNSSFDMNAGELILKKYYNIGIAVDTERGLVVPVIKNADQKSIRDIAIEVATLAEKARAGKLAIDDMRGGSFTITNLGGIGGTSFTPIVNYPEVAILGLSRSTLQPVVKDGAIVPRLMMPLSLTYDHRVIDGADGARFTTYLVQLFSDPIRLLMES